MMKPFVVSLALAVCLFGFYPRLAVRAQTVSARLDALFSAPYPVNGDVLVAENGRVIYQRSFGLADAKERLLNTTPTRFQIASVTKVVTSTAILQLKELGKLDLDDAYSKYFPDFPYPAITLRQLLSHTSGLPDFQIFEELVQKDPKRVFTNADIIPALKAWKGSHAVKTGAEWSYSNAGYCLLAQLIEKVSGRKYEDYVREAIFRPANMTDSYFETDPLAEPDKNKAREQRYPLIFDTELKAVESDKWRGFTGNGGIISTTADLLKFDQALYGQNLLSQATLQEAFTPAKLASGKSVRTDVLDATYGLGWFIFDNEAGGEIVWHGGGRPGIVTVFLRNITRKQTVVIFDNSYNRETYRTGVNVLKVLNSQPVIVRPKSLAHDYALVLVEKGVDAAFCRLVELRADTAHYYTDENEMNDLSLQLLYAGKSLNHNELALEVAKLNVAFFPQSSNVYDTYGEILAKTGKSDLAIGMYRRSIELDPKNVSGKQALDLLLKR